LDGKKIISDGSIARPNDGKVADNGTFIFNDWGLGEGLQGTFLAFDKAGVRLCSRRFKANLFNNGLSSNGDTAVRQTCNSYDSDDGSILTLFDLDQKIEIAHWIPSSGWADYYSFPQSGVIQLGYARSGAFAYSWSGDFLDKERWQEIRLGSGTYGEAMTMIEHLLKESPQAQDIERLLRSIDRIEPTIPTAETKSRAQAKKLRGLCLEAQFDLPNALRLYDDALSLDPKIGLKRRSVQLHKLLRTKDPSFALERK
jgi:tetratricopeptide (TPR) repeat protein